MGNTMSCNLCDSGVFKKFLPAFIRSYGTSEKFSLIQCTNCGLITLYPRPDWKELTYYYPETYYVQDTITKKGFLFRLKEIFDDRSRGRLVVNGGRLLDVGCGNGNFLAKMKDGGMNVFGLEPGVHGYKICKSRGLKVLNSFLDDTVFQEDFFDVVTLNHVLEHVPDPRNTLLSVRKITKKGGTVIIQVPNIGSFAFLVSRKYFLHLDVPRHLYHFSESTLEEYLKLSGLEISKVRYYTSLTTIVESLWLRIHKTPVSNYDKELDRQNFTILTILDLLFTPFKILMSRLQLGDSLEIWASKAHSP